MTTIKKYVDKIKDELEGARDYAEKYVEYKVKDDMHSANRYKEMANDELKHAMYEHEWAVKAIEKMRSHITPPGRNVRTLGKSSQGICGRCCLD